jgi:hypothetical protein
MLQGTMFNSALLTDVDQRSESYFKAMTLASLRFLDTGTMAGNNHVLGLGKEAQESMITLSTKIVLALHYNIMGKQPITPKQRITLTFYQPGREIPVDVIQSLKNWTEPKEESLHSPEIAQQFTYRYVRFNETFQKENDLGWDLTLFFHLHQGYSCFATVYEDKAFLKPPYDRIVRTIFD